MKRALSLVFVLVWVLQAADPAEAAAKRKRLSREETVELFRKLHAAVPDSKTFQAKLRRTEETGLVVDAEPLRSEGEIMIVRPARLRQEITKPRRSLMVVSDTDLWVYFPEAYSGGRPEVQHVDLTKGIRGREETSVKSILPWITFDFERLDRRFKITAARLEAPKGLVVRKVAREGTTVGAENASPVAPVALSSPCVYEITFVPRRAEYAPNMVQLVLTVYGEEPWPLRIEQESEEDVIETEFTDVILDAPVPDEVFEFKPPRGAKVTELSE